MTGVYLKQITHTRALCLMLLLIICAAALMFLMPGREPALPPIVIFAQPYAFPRAKLLDRIMPQGPTWAWLWHLRYWVLGKPKTLSIDSVVVEFKGSANPVEKLLIRGADYVGTDGLQVWRLGKGELAAVRSRLDDMGSRVNSSKVTTGDGEQCSIFSGVTVAAGGAQTPVGFGAEYFPRLGTDVLDLIFALEVSETATNEATVRSPQAPVPNGVSIRTNLAVAGRFQIPTGTAVLLIAEAGGGARSNRFGVFVEKTK